MYVENVGFEIPSICLFLLGSYLHLKDTCFHRVRIRVSIVWLLTRSQSHASSSRFLFRLVLSITASCLLSLLPAVVVHKFSHVLQQHFAPSLSLPSRLFCIWKCLEVSLFLPQLPFVFLICLQHQRQKRHDCIYK